MRRCLPFSLLLAAAILCCASPTPSAAAGLGATPADAFRVPEGFQVELLHEVPQQSQGSWVSMTVDPQGRLLTCDQYGGLFRVTLPADPQGSVTVEPVKADIGMAQGLLFAFDSLYVNVNGSGKAKGGVFRLRDTTGDDQYDSIEHILPLNNGGEHGPHALILSPDGEHIYLCAGNNTILPEKIDHSRVPRHWGEDHLLGRMPDARGHNADRLAPGGFVAKIDPDGSNFELVATGFRNHYDIAFNPQGELFTYDADMEWDVGTPWYRPTRVNHVISGGEYGWRNGTGKWPAYYPDSFGAAVDIGPGSPTGICFGTGAKFPAKYQQALFICDWSYGNIFAVHLSPDGSSYTGDYETFATASPLPVTDIVVHPDGNLYVTIGGRRTQSALYRIRYVGDESTAPAPATPQPAAVQARQLRHQLEAFHLKQVEAAVSAALQHVGDDDRGLRFAARVALEHQPVEQWRDRVLKLDDDHARIIGLVGLARAGQPSDQADALQGLLRCDWDALSSDQRLDLLRAYALVFLRLGEPNQTQREQVVKALNDRFPSRDQRVNRELAQVLIYLEAPEIVPRVVELLRIAPSQEDQIHYAFSLRNVRNGWTEPLRREYFGWFNDAAATRGGMSFGGFLENIRLAAIETLTEAEKNKLADVLTPPEPRDPLAELAPRETVREWTMADLTDAIASDDHDYRFERGKQMFAVAQCYKCHRMSGTGGILGPDLTGAGGRFSSKDLLTSIIEPHKEISDQYGATQFLTTAGRVVVGKVINMSGDKISVLTNMLDPSDLTSVDRKEIESVSPARTSMMPSGLLDTLKKDEILDLLAYLRSGGNPDHPLYDSADNAK